MNKPSLISERHAPMILGMISSIIKSCIAPKLHPVFLFHVQGKEQMIYIENDEKKVIITMEVRNKPITYKNHEKKS